jgi:hypothetical protein
VGLALALARLLAAFESGDPAIGHGDLSTKNVLWSLQRGPEIFVIDCDNSERFSRDGSSLADPHRRRAMTPNWDDPAVPRGSNPTELTDRYSLALIFLRIVGAANFPIQARQRSGDTVSVDFPVPPGPLASLLLDEANPVWDLCARGLSVRRPETRPPAAAWVPVLEAILAPRRVPVSPAGDPGDVTIRPVPSPRRPDYGGRRAPRVTVLRPPAARAPVAASIAAPRAGSGPSIWPGVREAIRRRLAGYRYLRRTR